MAVRRKRCADFKWVQPYFSLILIINISFIVLSSIKAKNRLMLFWLSSAGLSSFHIRGQVDCTRSCHHVLVRYLSNMQDATSVEPRYTLAFVEVCVRMDQITSNISFRLLSNPQLIKAFKHCDWQQPAAMYGPQYVCGVIVLYLCTCLLHGSVPHKAPWILPCDWLMMMQWCVAEKLRVWRAFWSNWPCWE